MEGVLESDVPEALLPDEVEADPVGRRQLLRAARASRDKWKTTTVGKIKKEVVRDDLHELWSYWERLPLCTWWKILRTRGTRGTPP